MDKSKDANAVASSALVTDSMKHENVNEVPSVVTAEAQPGSGAAHGSASYQLFKHMSDNYQLTMLESELGEIKTIAGQDALEYATRLATTIWEKHWKDDAPNWKPWGDIVGVLTQIDNMVAGMERRPPNDQAHRSAPGGEVERNQRKQNE